MKLCFLLFMLIFATHKSSGQITMKELLSLEIGENVFSVKQKALNWVGNNMTFYKGNFLNSYMIEIPNQDELMGDNYWEKYTSTFDMYGKSETRLRFKNEKLDFVQIVIRFDGSYTTNNFNSKEFYERALRTLITENMSNDQLDQIKFSNSKNLDIESAIQFGMIDCDPNSSFTKDYGFKSYRVVSKDTAIGKSKYLHISASRFNYPEGCNNTITIYLTSKSPEELEKQWESYLGIQFNPIEIEKKAIQLTKENGVYTLPVLINSVLTIKFILDLGASDVSISPDVFLTLYKTGTISDSDYVGSQHYKLGDGTVVKSNVFIIRKLQIGNITIDNVKASVSNSVESPLLLGQSALMKLKNYKIDNIHNLLVIE